MANTPLSLYMVSQWLQIFTGMQFWKVGSRKIYAVKEIDLRPSPRASHKGKAPASLDSDSSDKEFMLCSKKGNFVSHKQSFESGELLSEMQGLRKEIGQLFEVNKQLPIPMGLMKVLQETFQCCICRCTMSPPVIFGRCCKSLIGCQACVDQWFQGDGGLMQQTCPRCRTERAYAETCVVKGMDEFLVTIHPLVQADSPTSTMREEDI